MAFSEQRDLTQPLLSLSFPPQPFSPPVYSGIIPGVAREGSSPKWGFCHRGKTAGKTNCASKIPWVLQAGGTGALLGCGGAFWRAGNGESTEPAAPDPEGLSCPRAQRGRNLGRFKCGAESLVTGNIQAAHHEMIKNSLQRARNSIFFSFDISPRAKL